jgi:hypothetical protein
MITGHRISPHVATDFHAGGDGYGFHFGISGGGGDSSGGGGGGGSGNSGGGICCGCGGGIEFRV